MHQLDVCSPLRIVLGLMLRVTNLLFKLSSVGLVSGCTEFEVSAVVANFVLCGNSCHDHIQHVLHTCMHQLYVCSALRVAPGLMLGVTNLQDV